MDAVPDAPPNLSITTLCRFDTEFSADSVEWCPHKPHWNFFVCANYQLAEDAASEGTTARKRVGRILLFSISPPSELKLWQTLNSAAVLDQKWCHTKLKGASVLAIVNAERTIEVYKLKARDSFRLELIGAHTIASDSGEVLLLSLDWSTGKYESEEPNIICSDSKGRWHRFMFTKAEQLVLLESSTAFHDYEAWIAAFYYWDTNIFFTGADDSILLKFDSRTGSNPVAKNKSHDAGVTCIHSNAHKEFIIASGSYDEHLRLWDIRNMRAPSSMLKMPGPLWRLKWDPFDYERLLCACMLGGAHIVDASTREDLKIVGSCYEHKNITYGADWSFSNESEVDKYDHVGNRIIGTCSFYDHLLIVSKCSLEKR